jgi:hypothetical protein
LARSNPRSRKDQKKKVEMPGESCSAGYNPNLHLNRFLFFRVANNKKPAALFFKKKENHTSTRDKMERKREKVLRLS